MTQEEKTKESTMAQEESKATLIEEARKLGIKLPIVNIKGFKSIKPEDIIKEKARLDKDFITWLKIMIAKKKVEAKMSPIDKRRALLNGRLRAVKARVRAHTYSDATIKAWLEELDMINRNPKSWNKITGKGARNYVPGNKREKTARDILDGMDLE